MDTLKISKNTILELLGLMVVVFVLNLLYMNSLSSPYIQLDEYGYLGIAAYLAKIDWTDLLNSNFYYSFGYSLIIYPLFLIFNDPVYIYRGVMVINSLLFSLSIPLIYLFINSFNKSIPKKLLFSIIFLLSFNVITVLRVKSAFSESLIIFLFWAIIYIFRSLIYKFSNIKLILLSILLGYSYMVHQRTLVFIIATSITFLIMLYKKNLKIINFLTYLLIICSFVFITGIVKNYFLETIWTRELGRSLNGYDSILSSLVTFFTLNGFASFLRNLLGHIFYFGQSTFLLGFIGLYFLLKDFMLSASKFIKETNKDFYFLLFFVLCYLGTWFLSSLFFIVPLRVDFVVYGRYSEMLYLPITCYGIVRLLQTEKISYKLFTICSTILLALTVIVNASIQNIRDLVFASIQSPMLHPFLEQNDFINLYKAFFVTFVISFLIFTLLRKKKTTVIALLLYSVTSALGGYYMFSIPVKMDKSVFSSNKEKLIELRNSRDINSVYYLLGSEQRKATSYLQYYLFDKKLHYIYKDELDFLKKNISTYVKQNDYLITDYISPEILQNFTLDKFSNSLFFLKPKQNESGSSFKINAADIDNLHDFAKDTFVQSDGLQSNKNILYGPGIVLEKGTYKITINLELIDYTGDVSKPFAKVYIRGENPVHTYAYKALYLNDIPDKNFTCSFEIKNISQNDDFNLLVTANNNSIVKINNIAIQSK